MNPSAGEHSHERHCLRICLERKQSRGRTTRAVEETRRVDLDIADADSIRVILEHRRESPVALFNLDGRPHLKVIQVEPTNVGVYQSLLTEDESSVE